MKKFTPPMNVLFSEFGKGDVMCWSADCVYQIDESAGKDTTRTYDFREILELTYQGLEF